MTNLRDLCARMADELDHYRQYLMDDRSEVHALAAEARAALTEPEPEWPTDEELTQEWDLVLGARAYEEDVVDFARAVLTRWGK